ncbi:MAG: NADH:ubiquinone reductase (Na(+)-transporting) subunit C [Bacteroidetes bacterium 4572_128]|nr:MAG: NADH:ubiquinone reductase (Na(+)-transporting) subunit C [Bacteroidetes bacterium 4572_128]
MDKNSNLYTFIYASILVILVALVLSFTAITLSPMQQRNIEVEKKQNILTSVSIESSFENAEELFSNYIKESFLVDVKGNKKSGDAFLTDLKKEMSKDLEDRNFPVYIAEKDNKKNIIIPLLGKGLWGPLWGYISLEKDCNTIFGAVFDHKAETPGLGADINKEWFEKPFTGKKLFDKKGNFISITVYKGGKGAAKIAGDLEHGVDAISGGTITSKGLEDMVKDCMKNYEEFLKKSKIN